MPARRRLPILCLGLAVFAGCRADVWVEGPDEARRTVDRDGMLGGVDTAEVQRIAAVVRGRFIYSGGVGSLDDLRALAALRQVNLNGVIVGKALYEGRFTVAEGQRALKAA